MQLFLDLTRQRSDCLLDDGSLMTRQKKNDVKVTCLDRCVVKKRKEHSQILELRLSNDARAGEVNERGRCCM